MGPAKIWRPGESFPLVDGVCSRNLDFLPKTVGRAAQDQLATRI
jgi:hypothetical protein